MSDSEEDWEEVEGEDGYKKCSCLFCDEVHRSADETLTHCVLKHDVDLVKLKQSLCLDFYGWIKLVNYIRKEHPTVSALQSSLSSPFPWSKTHFLQPVIPDDSLLQLDFDDECEEGVIGERAEEPLSEKEGSMVAELTQRLKDTQLRLIESERKLKDAYEDMDRMRQAMSGILSEGIDKMDDKRKEEEPEEDGYFSSYSHFGIHEEMLKDQVRMESYQLFIYRNPELFKDKVVLDVGCGTGILSMFAVKSGASHVIAIDQSDIIHKAMEIASENNVSDHITFIHGRVEDVRLPVEQVDVIISEWMGYMLLFESMMDTVLYARDKWLKDRCQVYPNKCNISLVAIGDEYEYQNNILFWNDVGGFKMSCMRNDIVREARVMIVDEYSLISSADVIKKFDLSVVKPADLEFDSRFSLTMIHSAKCHAIVAYFDIGFEVKTYRIYFSTSPQDTPTHWKQTVFFLKEPLQVQTGDMLRGTFKCSRDTSDHRCMIISISMELTSFHKDKQGRTVQPVSVEQSYTLS